VTYFNWLALVVGFGLPLAALGAALSQGRAAAAAFEGMARQPELAPKLQTAMIIALAFVESLVIYALLIFFMLYFKMPSTDKMMELYQKTAEAQVQTRR